MSRPIQKLRTIELADWLELFIVANFAFLGVDISIAHSANAFGEKPEWYPLIFSAAATNSAW